MADICPLFNRTHSQGYCSVCPCLNNSVRTYKQFLYLYAAFFQQDLISNSMIALGLSRFFADEVFFYLRFLELTYISPIHYMFDWENHVLAKQL